MKLLNKGERYLINLVLNLFDIHFPFRQPKDGPSLSKFQKANSRFQQLSFTDLSPGFKILNTEEEL
ncbi:hypothetical protein BpHYR1_015790 [Brachionus plicatilis]|uniref:Uncharacterized protein n=1 Tax=Brachionus plicatilis TaxID=10195 RepID=A0A3M7T3S2_BRAPC|nr:hypothetical protein BpHYR1_015790 [Brachionus plicatilis]